MSHCDKPRYADFIAELASGVRSGVFVDDSGSPGASSALDSERKTWVAVVLNSEQVAEVLAQMPGALQELRARTGASEFHFTDIYSGKAPFKDIPLDLRLGLFRFMAFLFRTYQLPILVQTFTPAEVADLHARGLQPRVPPFDMSRVTDCALCFLLIRVKWFLERELRAPVAARVFVDEGFKKNGLALSLPMWSSTFADGLVCFARSESVLPLQLADFAAFGLNRTQMLLAKPHLSELDEHLLRILEPLAPLYKNISAGPVDPSALRGKARAN